MIPLLLLGLASLVFSSSSASNVGNWTVLDGKVPCIIMNAQIELTLSYTNTDGNLAEAGDLIPVPADSTTTGSNCNEIVQVGDQSIKSQVLQLNFPDNAGWNVRIFFTQDSKLGVENGDWTLYQVIVNANYPSMPDVFKSGAKEDTHTYSTVIDFNKLPDIAGAEKTQEGSYIDCPSPQGFVINSDSKIGPAAAIRLSNLQMQSYMTTATFGTGVPCPDDQKNVDMVPVIVSAALSGIVVLTLIAYFVYRSRHPTKILVKTQPEFEDNQKESSNLNHHDNYGYQDEDTRF